MKRIDSSKTIWGEEIKRERTILVVVMSRKMEKRALRMGMRGG